MAMKSHATMRQRICVNREIQNRAHNVLAVQLDNVSDSKLAHQRRGLTGNCNQFAAMHGGHGGRASALACRWTPDYKSCHSAAAKRD